MPHEASPKSPLLRTFGVEVSRRRLERKWSLDELAGRADVSRGMLIGIEHGRNNPSLLLMAKIAHALEVKLGELILAATKTTDD